MKNIGDRWMVWLDDPGGLFQHWWFYDSMILCIKLHDYTHIFVYLGKKSIIISNFTMKLPVN